jgi:adenylate cyclase
MTAKVLVVDDEPDLEDLVRQRFRRQIKEGSIAFGFARDGVEALALLAEQGDFDMVVSDINMPRMDGLTLLAKLQEEATKFSTVIVSAYGDMANIRTAMNRGAFDFLTKPIDFTDFEATLRKTIAHVGHLKDARQRQAEAERAHASLSRYETFDSARRTAGIDVDGTLSGQHQRTRSAPPTTANREGPRASARARSAAAEPTVPRGRAPAPRATPESRHRSEHTPPSHPAPPACRDSC